MEKTKPTFKVTPPTVVTVDVDGKVYNAKPVGPATWVGLRSQDYGPNFRQGTFGENFNVEHAAYLNPESEEAQGIIRAANKLWVTGNTGILYTPELIFVEDFPEVKDKRLYLSKKSLEKRLGSKEAKGVIFSNDGSVRAIPYNFAREWQKKDQIKDNPFSIALTGDEHAPSKLAEICEAIDKPWYIWALDKGTESEIRVPGLVEGAGGLCLGGDFLGGFGDGRCSFGVRP